MIQYGCDEGNPALEERVEVQPRDEDREYMELFYTYQALLEEVRRLHEEERVRQATADESPSPTEHSGSVTQPMGEDGHYEGIWPSELSVGAA
jgi:hypothetical protein